MHYVFIEPLIIKLAKSQSHGYIIPFSLGQGPVSHSTGMTHSKHRIHIDFAMLFPSHLSIVYFATCSAACPVGSIMWQPLTFQLGE